MIVNIRSSLPIDTQCLAHYLVHLKTGAATEAGLLERE